MTMYFSYISKRAFALGFLCPLWQVTQSVVLRRPLYLAKSTWLDELLESYDLESFRERSCIRPLSAWNATRQLPSAALEHLSFEEVKGWAVLRAPLCTRRSSPIRFMDTNIKENARPRSVEY